MGKIKKILENELVGGTQSTDVYPVTSTKAVYDENNERLDNTLNRVESGIIYDVSAYNSGVVFESLSALLSSSNLSTLIPTSVRHGGMIIRFIQGYVSSSDNKYVQYRYKLEYKSTTAGNTAFLNTENWEETDSSVKATTSSAQSDLDIADKNGNVLVRYANGHIQVKNFSSVDILDSIQAILSNIGFDNVPEFSEKEDYAIGDIVRYKKYVYVFTSEHTAGEWDETKVERTVINTEHPVDVKTNNRTSDLDISDERGNVLARFKNGHFKTKNFDSSKLNNTKYVDCVGDSLTMGASWLGWYETNLQTLLGLEYTVRNWGVGGETKSTIMARQGSASVKFSSSFILPANGTNVTLPLMTSRFDNGDVTPLLQGSTVDSSHTSKMVNPCFIAGVECEMTNSGTTYYLKRKNVGNRDLVINENAPILMNTGKQTKDAFITIVWFGTNGKPTSNEQSDALVSAYERVVTQLPNSNFIFVGLHTLGKTLAEYYENAMFEKFGNKFFNIREYCCSDILYDAGITPTQADLENMANGICPASALYDSTHFKPATNACIGKRLYEMIVQLGYINN